MSKYYILTRPSVSASARALAEKLSEELNTLVRVRFGNEKPGTHPVIRWGNSDFHGAWSFDTPYNDAEKIRTSANKMAFSNAVHALSIPVIRFNRGVPDRFPVVIRKTLTGRGGEGIVIARNYDEWSPNKQFSWSTWHKFPYELGVHIFNGNVLKVFKKVWIGQGNEPEFPIRNLEKGYKYKRVEDFQEAFPKLMKFTQGFFEQFKIAFGRMDIAWDDEAKTYRIIEFNSAPGIATNEDTLQLYTDSFLKHIFKIAK